MPKEIVVTLNAGSSSLKIAVFDAADSAEPLARGQVESLGAAARLSWRERGAGPISRELGPADHRAALDAALAAMEVRHSGAQVRGVGHRVVHGGVEFSAPCRLGEAEIAKLRELVPLAPLHQPHNLAGIEAAAAAFPDAVQAGCFDTAFHRGRGFEAESYALPRVWYERGVRRYGFHGLSYQSVFDRLSLERPDLATGRVIVAHLGNGASLCAMRGGRCVETSMGFSVLDGVPMGTRCGQIDPGVLLYMMQSCAMSAEEVSALLYRDSGLKGVSGLSHDMRVLESAGTGEAEAAIALFAYRIRCAIGSMAAALGGVDTLVFCGGIGENGAALRERVCAGLGWFGIALDRESNDTNAPEIGEGKVPVLIVPSDEERVIARAVQDLLTAA